MKRLGIMLAVAVALVATPALASSHGSIAPGASFGDRVVFEVEHLFIHLQLTLNAMLLLCQSPTLGWAMLGDQTLCAGATPLASALFSTALTAILSFWAFMALFFIGVPLGVARIIVWVHGFVGRHLVANQRFRFA